MRRLSTVLAVATLASTYAVGCENEEAGLEIQVEGLESSPAPGSLEAAAGTTQDDALGPHAEGAKLYAKYCALCHGAKGEGYVADHANALFNSDFLALASDGFLFVAIRDGRPGTPMSAWGRSHGGPLDVDQIQAIVAYIASHRETSIPVSAPVRVDGDPMNGAKIYARECASCHGERGQGQKALSLANPEFLATTTDAYIRESIRRGRRGTEMKSFKDALSAKEIDDVTAFVRSLGPRRATEAARSAAKPAPEKRPRVGHTAPSRSAAPDPDQLPKIGPPPVILPRVLNRGRPTLEPELRDGMYLAADRVKKALDEKKRIVLLDARATSDWLTRHIAGATPVPFYDMEPMIEALPNDGTLIIAYCACPHAASGKVVRALRARGFDNSAVLDEGFPYWVSKGYPTRSGERP